MAEQPPPKAEAVAEETKFITSEEFITRWPLYSPAPVDDFIPPGRFNPFVTIDQPLLV